MKTLFRTLLILCLFGPTVLANRLFTSGAETNNFTATEWSVLTNTPTIVTSACSGAGPHSGTYAFEINNSSSQKAFRRDLPSTVAAGTYFVRFYLCRVSGGGRVFGLYSNSNSPSFHVAVNGDAQMVLTNQADSSTITSGTIATGVWYRVELRVVISDTVGELELRVNGISQGILSSKDTLPGNIQRFSFGNDGNSGTHVFNFDDIAINDSNGGFQNSWPGVGKIVLAKPTGDDTVVFTKTGANCSANNNTDCVDDEPGLPDNASGYNASTSSTDTDRFNISSLPSEVPSDADIVLLDVYGRQGSNGTSGTRTITYEIWDQSGTQTQGPTCSTSINGWRIAATNEHLVFEVGSRSKSDVNSFDIGYRRTASGSNEVRVTALWVNVEWTTVSTPAVGIDMTTSGAREVFVPGLYEVGTFAHRLSNGNCTTTAGIPAVGVTFYEPCFGNATGAVETHPATSVYDAFNVPLMILKEGDPNSNATAWDKCYSTKQCVNEDNTYIWVGNGNSAADILFFTGASAGQRAVSWSLGTVNCSQGACGWMLGVHKDKFFYLENENLKIYKVSTARWCTALSADALSDTCNDASEVTYHASPIVAGTGTVTIGGNEGDIIPGNKLPITRTNPNPREIYVYDIVAKTSVQMASVPTGFLDWAEISVDGATVRANVGNADYEWNAATGAILHGGASQGDFGHRGKAIRSDGTNILIGFLDIGGNPYVQGHLFKPWGAGASTTNLIRYDSPRDPQSSAEDAHWSAFQSYPSPAHYLALFDYASSNTVSDQIDVTAGALSASWDNDWRYLSREIGICDHANPAADIVNAPKCWRLAHGRAYDDNRDCSHCVTLTRDGKYAVWRSHLGTDISSATLDRVYIVRAGPLF